MMNTRILLLIVFIGLLSGCTAYVPGGAYSSVSYDSGPYYGRGYGSVSRPVYVEPRAVIAAPVYPPVVRFSAPAFGYYGGHHGHHEHHGHGGFHGDFHGGGRSGFSGGFSSRGGRYRH